MTREALLDRLRAAGAETERGHLRVWLGESRAAKKAPPARARSPWDDAYAGRLLSLAGRFDEARARLERAAEALPGEAAVAAWLGELALLRRDHDEAARRLEAAASLDPRLPWTYVYRAALSYRSGRLDAAESDAARVLELLPAGVSGPALKAVLAAARGAGRDEAQGWLDKALAADQSGWVHALSGALRASWNDLEGARADLERALARERSPWFLLARATVSNRMGEFWKALSDLKRAERRLPGSVEVHLLAASIHHDQAQYAKAAARLTSAHVLAPSDSSILHRRARVYFVQGLLAEAQRDLREAVRLSGGETTLRQELVQLLLVRGYEKEALRELSQGEWPKGARAFWTAYADCRARRYEKAEKGFAAAAAEGGAAFADRAGFYRWVARLLKLDGPMPLPPEGKELSLVGLGYRLPFQVSAEAVRVLARAEAIYSNLSDTAAAEFLGLFPAPFQAIVFRSTQQQADASARRCVAGFARKRVIAMATRGQPVVYGRLAWHLVRHARKLGVPVRVPCSTSIFDTIGGLAGDAAEGGLQILDARAIDLADPSRAAVVYTAAGGNVQHFVVDVAKLYAASHPCWLLPGSGENELVVERTTVGALPEKLAKADPACTIYLPAKRGR